MSPLYSYILSFSILIINKSKLVSAGPDSVDAMPQGVHRSEYCEMCHTLKEYIYQESLKENTFSLKKIVNRACTPSRFENRVSAIDDQVFKQSNLVKSCNQFITTHKQEILELEPEDYVDEKTLFNKICNEMSHSCMGVKRHKDPLKDQDHLTDEAIARMLEVNKDKVRRVTRMSAEEIKAHKKAMRHDEL